MSVTVLSKIKESILKSSNHNNGVQVVLRAVLWADLDEQWVSAEVAFSASQWELVSIDKNIRSSCTDDPTQWIFHGHPALNDDPLQAAFARLLGYHWPAEEPITPNPSPTGRGEPENSQRPLSAALRENKMELSDEARAWIAKCRELHSPLPVGEGPGVRAHVDDDGIACIPAIRGEKPAAERLLSLLQAAYGEDWSAHQLNQLLADAGAKGLDWWLREKFFEQYCKLFQHRPFIWYLWDGLKDGFAALVNFHKLDHKTLETLA